MRLGPPVGVGGPLLGQVQLPIHQRPPLPAGIGQEDPDLAVLDPPGGAGILALHPGRLVALLEEPGLVHHQHPTRIAEALHDVVAHLITQPLGVPAGGGQQPLHPIWGRLSGLFGQLPAVLALNVAEQAAHKGSDPPADLGPGKPGADPFAQSLELRRPAFDLRQHPVHPPRSTLVKERADYPITSAAVVLGPVSEVGVCREMLRAWDEET